ncbi:MAG: hypothetical protein WD065_19565 [Planctomycetaceae bacterium]
MAAILGRLPTVVLCFVICGACDDVLLAQTNPSARTAKGTDNTDNTDADPNDDATADGDADAKSEEDDKDEKPSATPRARLKKKRSSKREKPDEVGPLSESPLLAMEVRDDGPSRELREHGEESCIEAETRLAEFEELLTSNRAGKIDPVELGKTLIPIMHVDRAARRLTFLGEPSGWELGSRHAILLQRLRSVVEQFRKVPGVAQKLSNTAPLVRVARMGEAQLVKVNLLSRKKNFAAAETLMDDILDSVHSVGVLYPGDVSTSILGNINSANSTAQAVFADYRRTQALAEMSKEQKRNTPDFAKLLKELQAATEAIASGRDPQVGSRMMSGPEWLDHFSERWQHLYFEANRCFGLDVAAATIGADKALMHSDKLVADYERFVADALKGMAGLIRADARRTGAEQVATVYAAYLQSIAKFAALGDVAVVETALLPALDELVVKSPELQADAQSYYTFSTELLRWRQRVADGYVAAKMTRYQGVNGAFYQAVPDPETGTTLFERNSMGNMLLLTINAPHAIQVISPAIVTKKVYAQGGLSSRNERRQVTSYEEGSVYASIPHDVDLSLAVEELKSVLLVSDAFPPLTLDAVLAIETATKGDLWQFGGEVTDVELEGRITKLANASPDDWGLFYLTTPMTRVPSGYSLQHVMAHCHVRPDWLRHRYFFVELN